MGMFYITCGYGAIEEITPEFVDAPVIDGVRGSEWNGANTTYISLDNLSITLKVMQADARLFISIEFDLESSARKETEFIGILISNSSLSGPDNFIDAKIVRFSNLTNGDYTYLDCYVDINNYNFSNDNNTDIGGEGAAKMENAKTIFYEFSLPIGIIGDNEDVDLDYGKEYAINITYGEWGVYPGGISKSHCVLITILIPLPPVLDLTEIVIFILSIVSFSCIGAFLTIYIYKIIILKKKIGRLIG
jgi:hypothetical protein